MNKVKCPSCNNLSLSRNQIFKSLIPFSKTIECENCGNRYALSNNFKNGIIGCFILVFSICGAFSVKERSYSPYLFFIIFLMFTLRTIYLKTHILNLIKYSPKKTPIDYALLIIVMLFIFYYFSVIVI